ncbi:MAG: hypothetical protein B7Z70_08945, partial [Acidithiobacillus ferrivorans]
DKKSGQKKSQLTIQTGIDGLRIKADETGIYAPGPEPRFNYDSQDKLYSATATVLKRIGNEWMPVSATAIYSEYVQTAYGGGPNSMWAKMPHAMLGKCAEALAFPIRVPFGERTSHASAIMDVMRQRPSSPISTGGPHSLLTSSMMPFPCVG